jgi:hypothetical protein
LHEVEVVPGSHRRVEIDHLHFRELLELPDPPDDVRILDGETLALDELHDGVVFQIDRGDQHRRGQPRKHESTK